MRLAAFQSDGTTPLNILRFDSVKAGETATLNFTIRNTSDTTATGVQISIVQTGELDLEAWLTGIAGGVAFDFLAGAVTLPDIPAQAGVDVALTVSVPDNTPALDAPLVAALDISSYA